MQHTCTSAQGTALLYHPWHGEGKPHGKPFGGRFCGWWKLCGCNPEKDGDGGDESDKEGDESDKEGG